MTPASVRNTWRQRSWLLWPTVRKIQGTEVNTHNWESSDKLILREQCRVRSTLLLHTIEIRFIETQQQSGFSRDETSQLWADGTHLLPSWVMFLSSRLHQTTVFGGRTWHTNVAFWQTTTFLGPVTLAISAPLAPATKNSEMRTYEKSCRNCSDTNRT